MLRARTFANAFYEVTGTLHRYMLRTDVCRTFHLYLILSMWLVLRCDVTMFLPITSIITWSVYDGIVQYRRLLKSNSRPSPCFRDKLAQYTQTLMWRVLLDHGEVRR